MRENSGEAVICVFNLSPETVAVNVRGVAADAGALSRAADLVGGTLTLGPNGFAFLGCAGPARDVDVAFEG